MAYGLTQSPLLVKATPSYFETGADPTALNITGALTIEAWIKLASSPGSGVRYEIVSKPDSAGGAYSTYQFELYNDATNVNIRFVNGLAGSPTQRVIYAWNPSTSVWYHVAVTRTSGDVYTLYVDGSQVAQNTSAGSVDSTTSKVYIGNFSGSTSLPFDGRISLVRIWNTDRSQSNINANKCVVYGSAQTNMQAEWSLDNVLTDASGNGYTLTNINSVAFATDTPAVCAVTTTVKPRPNLLTLGVG